MSIAAEIEARIARNHRREWVCYLLDFLLEIIERTDAYLAETFASSLKAELSAELGIEADVRMGDAEALRSPLLRHAQAFPLRRRRSCHHLAELLAEVVAFKEKFYRTP